MELQSLSGLKSLTDIGFLSLINLNITNLDGLQNIELLGALYIGDNSNLISLEGLSKLKEIKSSYDGEGSFTIKKNPKLLSLNGLDKIDYIQYLQIIENQNLQSLEGLESLQEIGVSTNFVDYYSLTITGNPNLTSLKGIENIANCNCKLAFDIQDNNKLSDFCALKDFANNPNNGIYYKSDFGFVTSYYNVSFNAYNPSYDDLKIDLCMQ